MDSEIQRRFYDVSEHFGDDERLIAHSIPYFIDSSFLAEVIYNDLIECNYCEWIDYIEQVIIIVDSTELAQWMETTEKGFKMSTWSRDDFETITRGSIDHQMSIFDILGDE